MADEPACLSWSCEQVANWVAQLGFPQYKECFTRNLIDGRKLILIDASHLPQLGITDFKHIQFISQCVRQMLEIEDPDWSRSISLPHREPLGMYLERKSITGYKADNLTFNKYQKEVRRDELAFHAGAKLVIPK
ncbi:sterile alpha motif domain-containing protein 15-like [Amphiura filiformis]|uniref:sterile alpha motif domain-containing protein 15-like n=1 Tax=Amphiura filiformis TaxID=82378 RepID=UPI003B218CFA